MVRRCRIRTLPSSFTASHPGKSTLPSFSACGPRIRPLGADSTSNSRTHPDDGHEGDNSRSQSPGTPQLLSETAFRRALDEYSKAEFRLGR